MTNLMSNDFYTRLINVFEQKERSAELIGNQKPKILLVEGILDRLFFESFQSEDVEIYSAGNKSYFKQRNINPRGKVKEAVCGATEAVRTGLKKYEHFGVFGVIDRDFDNTISETTNLFMTETNDLETLLLSSKTFSFTVIPTCTPNLENSILGLSYQMGSVRKGFIKFKDGKLKNGKPLNMRDVVDEKALFLPENKIFHENCDLKIDDLLNLFSKNPDNYFRDEISRFLGKSSVQIYLKDNKIMDNTNSFVDKVNTFDCSKIHDYWLKVRGHDICGIASALIPDIKNFYDDSLEAFIARHSNREKFKETLLYKKMSCVGLLA